MHAISIERVLQRSFTSYPVVAVGVLVAAAKEMRVLKGIEQVSGTIRVIAVAATDVLAAVKSGVGGGLLRHPIHRVEGIEGDDLAVRPIDLFSPSGCVVPDRGRLTGTHSDLVWSVPRIIQSGDIAAIERIEDLGEIADQVEVIRGSGPIRRARRQRYCARAPIIVIHRVDLLAAWKNHPGDTRIGELVIVGCAIGVVVK